MHYLDCEQLWIVNQEETIAKCKNTKEWTQRLTNCKLIKIVSSRQIK